MWVIMKEGAMMVERLPFTAVLCLPRWLRTNSIYYYYYRLVAGGQRPRLAELIVEELVLRVGGKF